MSSLPTTSAAAVFDDADGNLRVLPGEIIASTRFFGIVYVIEERIGSGSFGIVIRVRCDGVSTSTDVHHGNAPLSGLRYAIKIARSKPAFVAQASIELSLLVHLNRLRTEANTSSSSVPTPTTNHLCGVIELVDHFSLHGHVCLVEELLPGTLLDALAVRSYTGLPLRDIATILFALFQTLHELHAIGLLHGDVKPENVMLSGVGGRELLAIIAEEGDGGGTKTDSSSHSMSVTRVGSSAWRASTAVSRDGSVTSRCASAGIVDSHSATASGSAAALPSASPLTSAEELSTSVSAARARASLARSSNISPSVHLVDFGSSGYEEGGLVPQSAYAQSRFYRAPEVLLGLRHTGAIDMWSAGCLAAELWLGLPIFGGFDEHDCVSRMCLLLGLPPEGMLESAPLASRFFVLKRSSGLAVGSATDQTAQENNNTASVAGSGWGWSAGGTGAMMADHAVLTGDGRHRSLSAITGFTPPPARSSQLSVPTTTTTTTTTSNGAASFAQRAASMGMVHLSLNNDTIDKPGKITWVAPVPVAAAVDSWFRLKTPEEFSSLKSESSTPTVPHATAKHYLSPVPLGITLISVTEETGLIPSLVTPASTQVYSQVGDALLALYSDSNAIGGGRVRNIQTAHTSVTIPNDVSMSDAHLRVAFADLVTRLLVYDPRTRLTAAEALDHYFFTAAGVEGRSEVPAQHTTANAHLRARRGDHGCAWGSARVWNGGGATGTAVGHSLTPVASSTSIFPMTSLSNTRGGGTSSRGVRGPLNPDSPPWNPGSIARGTRSMTVTEKPAWLGRGAH